MRYNREVNQFRLSASYQPTGDQPRAIAQLVGGLTQGEREQTLLGVTGSGKSVIGESPVLVRRNAGVESVAIGVCIDELMEQRQADVEHVGDSEVLNLAADEALETMSFNPQTGRVAWRRVRQLSRHWTPQTMTITTVCGRSVTATMDHNFYTIRGGQLQCVAGDALREGDYVPLPRISQAGDEDLAVVDIMPTLLASRHEYYTQVALSDEQTAQLEAAGVSRQKIWRIVHEGERLSLADVARAGLATDDMTVTGYNGKVALPLRLPVTDDLLRLMGYYIAEGCHTDRYVTISTGSAEVAQALAAAVKSLGLSLLRRPSSYDYQVTHVGLSDLLLAWCGRLSTGKCFPAWWPRLSRRQLGVLLGAYFDGDGSVERQALTMTTVSDRLASDLQYIGDWLGVSLRRRTRTVKYATERRTAYVVSASGAERLKLAAILELKVTHKRRAAERVRNTATPLNTNVDIVPLYGADFLAFRRCHQLSQQGIADMTGVSRSLISMIEKGVRRPSRDVIRRLLRAMDEQSYDVAEWQYLTELRWGKIASITVERQRRRVYDFSVAGNETFLAGSGGIFVHNTFTMANIIAQRNVPTLVLAHNKTLAAQLFAEFKEFFPDNEVHYFVSYFDYYQPEAYIASSDTYIEKDSKINDEIDRLRHAATSALLTRRDVIIVASVSCIYGIGSPDTYADMALQVTCGERRVQDKFVRLLTDIQYKRNDIDFARGTFRVRGDVVDIYPAGQDQAVRVEFFGDEVDRLTRIDALTGEILAEPESVTIFPSSHYATPRERIERAIVGIEQEFAERLAWFEAHDKLLEAQRLSQRTKYDLEMLRETGFVKGIENYSRYLTDREPGEQPATLIDYFPDDWLLLVDESHMTLPQVRGMYNGDRARKEVLVEHGFRLPSALDNRPLRFDEFERHINQAIYVSATPGDYEIAHSPKPAEQLIRPTGLLDPPIEVWPTSGQVDDLMEEIRRTIAKGHRVLVTTLTKRMAEDLSTYLSDNGVKTAYLHSEIDTLERGDILKELRLGTYDVLVGINLLREGLDLPEVSLVAIMDADKEGFLRSESALIQTIGRAARHVEGRVLMYGDTVTDSMRRAIEETNRRRAVQQAYNEKHNITPQTIQKKIDDGLRAIIPTKDSDKAPTLDLKKIPKDEYGTLIKELTGQMELHSANLEFEKAAELRDIIAEIRQAM